MTAHAPKLLALEALVAGRLSPRGKARLEAHLADCETCQHALRVVREYRALRDAARDVAVPELSWDKLDAALDRKPAPVQSTRGKWIAVALPTLAIAATLVIGWIGIWGQRDLAEQAARERTEPAAVASPASVIVRGPLTGSVTLAMGERDLSALREGDVLMTAQGAELHAALGAGTGIVLWPESELELTRLRDGEILLTLRRGRVSSVVRKLDVDASYVIAAAAYRAEVRGTRFVVGSQGDDIDVGVHEGKVVVMRGDTELAALMPGQTWSSGGEGELPSERLALGLEPGASAWPSLTLPALPEVTAWLVGERRISPSGMLRMRAPTGPLSLGFEDRQGLRHTLQVEVSPEGAVLTESEVRRILEAPREPQLGTLDPALITPVMRAALPNLRRCYEQTLRRVPSLEGTLTLAVRIAPDGHVVRARLRSESPLPEALDACIVNQMRLLQFPRPVGGAVELEVPLKLASTPQR